MSLVQVRLARDCMQTPWGFRLQGGKDLNQELTVQRVFANTPSERELQRGDVIVAINGRDTSNLTHKQAQDAISGGGGQIEFLVQRPTGAVNIKPLTPISDTRAPTYPQTPTRAPQINIPIQRKSGPPSPSRVIQVSQQKPSPVSKPTRLPQTASDATDMSAGFIPTKITMNKYGGGGPAYGSQYGGPQSPPNRGKSTQYRPVAAPASAQPARDYYDAGQQQQYQQQTQNQFNAPSQSAAIQRSRKPVPNFGNARQTADSSYMNFGVDYTKPQAQPQPKKSSPRQRPPPVNRRGEDDLDGQPWSDTLRGESKILKPWEREAMESERYQSGTVDEPYRPHSQPPTAPKPRITQISAQSSARPTESQLSPSAGYSTQSKTPALPGERDWNDSYVYKMIHSSEKTTSSSRQDAPGQTPHGETVTTTRVTQESKFPGQEPQRKVTETVQRGGAPDYRFDSAIGMSDF